MGSVAVAILAKLGYPVTASTGRPEEQGGYLTDLGATAVIDRAELADPGRPLQSQRWAGAIDPVGSHTLANVLAQTRYGGTVAACGLAQGPDLPATVMPFILRGITLSGINSVEAPLALREAAHERRLADANRAFDREIAERRSQIRRDDGERRGIHRQPPPDDSAFLPVSAPSTGH